MESYKEILEKIAREESRLSKNEKSFAGFINLLPKAEIHLHVEALVSPESLQKLNEKHQFYPECTTTEALKTKLGLKKIRDLNEMIDQFLKIQSFFRVEEDFALITSSIPQYMNDNQLNYMEVHFAPSSFIRNGLNFDGMISNLEAGMNAICKEMNVDIRIIIDLSRTFGVDNAMNNLTNVKNYLASHKNSRIIAVGLGGAEKSGTPQEYSPVFKQAKEWGIPSVAHGGEDSGPEQLWDTLKYLDPLRIGHGTCAFLEDDLMEELKKRAVPMEICPTSNVITGRFMKKLSEHPIRKFYDYGLSVTLNTDDPMIFGIQLNDEYCNLYSDLHFTHLEIVEILKNTYRSSFMPEKEKQKNIDAVDKAVLKAVKEVYPQYIN